jgi:hypothetical protein
MKPLSRPSSNSTRARRYDYDYVFPPETNQDTVFSEVTSAVASAMEGYRVCIFAYGQTGSGKTHTMEGPRDDRGVNFRALEEMFEIASVYVRHPSLSPTLCGRAHVRRHPNVSPSTLCGRVHVRPSTCATAAGGFGGLPPTPPQPVSQHPVRPSTCATATGGVRGVSPTSP